jgi:tetratricopeptide (TPR) repeat protein
MNLEPDFAAKTEDIDAARRKLEEVDEHLAKNPDDALSLARRAILKIELELDPSDAVADCERAMKLDPKLSLAWSARASVHIQRKDWAAAVTDANEALARNSDDVRALVDRGMARHELKELDLAIADFDRAIEILPRGGIYALRGLAKGAAHNFVGAVADLKRAIKLDPDPQYLEYLLAAAAGVVRTQPDLSAREQAMQGLAKVNRDDIEGAFEDAAMALALDKKEPRAWACRAFARLHSGDLDGAIADFSRTIELDPADAIAAFNRGQCKLRQNDAAGAQADYELAVARDAGYLDAWVNLGVLRKRAGDLDGALAAQNRAMAIDPEHIGAWT